MYMKSRSLIGVLLGAFTGATAMAQSPSSGVSYDYIGARYLMQEWNECDQDGPNVYGSFSINDQVYAVASVADVDGDGCGSRSGSIGLGYHSVLNDSFDWYGTLSAMKMDYGPDDDRGLMVVGGLRGYLSQQLESYAQLSHHTVGDGETALGAGLAYWLSKNWAATGDVSIGGDTTSFAVGARLSF